MSEEFQESDIIFSDQSTIPEYNRKTILSNISNDETSEARRVAAEKTYPVSIPVNILGFMKWGTMEEEKEGDKTPPHIIIERRMKEPQQIAFSVYTLKGRDLNRHRNSVLKMTGFLEA